MTAIEMRREICSLQGEIDLIRAFCNTNNIEACKRMKKKLKEKIDLLEECLKNGEYEEELERVYR